MLEVQKLSNDLIVHHSLPSGKTIKTKTMEQNNMTICY